MNGNLQKKGTTLQTEVLAGISSFLATAYIIVVNPSILSQTGMPFAAVSTATILVSFFSSCMMGWYARNPILVAPGMGLNAFFTFSAVMALKIPWPVALGAVFWSGIVFLLLSVFNIRTHIVRAIPRPLRHAIAAGIGLFITLIGLSNAHFISYNPATIIGMGKLDASVWTFIAGLVLTAILLIRRVKGAILIGIVLTTLAAIPIGRWWGFPSQPLVAWKGLLAAPDFSLFLKLDLIHSLRWSVLPVIFAFVFTDLFDSLSTFVGLAEAADLVDENGEPSNIKRSLLTDAVSTTLSGLLGSSPGTAYIESAVGIEAGGRTGITAITGGLLFLPFLFLSPLLSVVPAIATAPALVLVGVFMIRPVTRIAWQQLDEAIPAFLSLVLIPYTYSITQGIIWGLLSWTALKLMTGRRKELTAGLLVIDIFVALALIPIKPASTATPPVTAILGAFPPEMTILKKELKDKKEIVIERVVFTTGMLGERPVVIAQTGMGKVNAAMATTLVIEHFHPQQLIFSGIAGGVDTSLLPGDLVIGTALSYHDYGTLTPDSLQVRATRNPFTLEDNPVLFPCDPELIHLAEEVGGNLRLEAIHDNTGERMPHFRSGVIVTGDVFVASSIATAAFRRQQHALATEMEGAAVGQICWQQHVPFLVIRSMSDNANSHAASDVKAFYQVAADNSARMVIALAARLSRN